MALATSPVTVPASFRYEAVRLSRAFPVAPVPFAIVAFALSQSAPALRPAAPMAADAASTPLRMPLILPVRSSLSVATASIWPTEMAAI